MDAEIRQIVRERAYDRCEYCRTPQAAAPFITFHVEHIVARQHAVDDSLSNLALACPDCNRHKGPNLVTLLPGISDYLRLFNPRSDRWSEHFSLNGATIEGLSDIGRATAQLLQFNSNERIEIRRWMIETGAYRGP